MNKRPFNITLCIMLILGSLFVVGGDQQVSAEEITIFESPGMVAYGLIDTTVFTLENVEKSCSDNAIYSSEGDYFICSVHLEEYAAIYDTLLLVHSDGYILGYYRSGEPTAKIVDIINFDLENNLLVQTISKVVKDINLIVDPDELDEDFTIDINYYHFGYPDANKILFVAEDKDIEDIDNFFIMNLPDENNYFERSYAFYQNYYPKFILSGDNFVLDNAVYAGSPTLGTIYGVLSASELAPETEYLFTVDSYTTAPDGSIPAGNGVISILYKDNGPEIFMLDNDLFHSIALIRDENLETLLNSIFPKPNAFDKSGPDPDEIQSIAPTISWENSSGATEYEFCFDTSDNAICDSAWINVGNVLSTTIDLEFETDYYWQVRAVNDYGFTYADGGTWWSLSTQEMPLPGSFDRVDFTGLISPTNVPLSWRDSYAASSYEYCIDQTDDEICDVDDEGNEIWVNVGLATSKLLNVDFGAEYFWQVRAVNTAGTTYANDGVWGSFTTSDTFNRISPEDLSTNLDFKAALRWEKLGTATYEYCFSTKEECSDWTSTGSSTSVSISKLRMNTTYYWQVRATNLKGEIVYANNGVDDLWEFTTKNPKKK